jgi:pyruvate ferredoxin oxidoreductase beta subunit
LIEKAKRKPIREYLSFQGRFRKLTEDDIEKKQKLVDEDWERYHKLASNNASDLAPCEKI